MLEGSMVPSLGLKRAEPLITSDSGERSIVPLSSEPEISSQCRLNRSTNQHTDLCQIIRRDEPMNLLHYEVVRD